MAKTWPPKILLFLLICFLLIIGLLISSSSEAYEKEVVWDEPYQTNKEIEKLADRFKLDFTFGYGYYSYPALITGIYGTDPKVDFYLDKLGLKFSENTGTFRLAATATIAKGLGIYLVVPTGIVKFHEKTGMEQLPEEDKFKFEVGDIFGGIYLHILPETKYLPNLVINIDANSDTAKYSSLGDGVWDFTGGIQARKLLSSYFYLFALGDYTYKMEKNNVQPGNVVGYGGGLGFIFGGGNNIIEASLKGAEIAESKINDKPYFDKNRDLIFNLSLKSLIKRASFSITIGNLNHGLDIKGINSGFEASFPIF
jgi:hypothetical protein